MARGEVCRAQLGRGGVVALRLAAAAQSGDFARADVGVGEELRRGSALRKRVRGLGERGENAAGSGCDGGERGRSVRSDGGRCMDGVDIVVARVARRGLEIRRSLRG